MRWRVWEISGREGVVRFTDKPGILAILSGRATPAAIPHPTKQQQTKKLDASLLCLDTDHPMIRKGIESNWLRRIIFFFCPVRTPRRVRMLERV
jgi:hypothetical protein